ncbi:hypothetical protein [Mitsuaria sp. 7]|uniref:hypothetical protein n=1 Tax=Mitsuaria sp. 7 TaxID=1658665 RepID=UPI0007DD5D17|nr:hypothetical protein [Mitsuaria sp. 7]ANH69929.1 hypothetical protein ABE85_24285 [Mitsuaria sp. 7]
MMTREELPALWLIDEAYFDDTQALPLTCTAPLRIVLKDEISPSAFGEFVVTPDSHNVYQAMTLP